MKEIDHIFVSSRRILQNYRFISSTEFFVIDHRLFVATLKLHVESRKPPRCDNTVFHLEKLKDLTYAQEYVVTGSKRFGVLAPLRTL